MKIVIAILLCFLPTFALADEIRIGVLPSLTGPFADLGEDCRQGVQAAVKALVPEGKVNDRELKVFFGDSQADPKVAVAEFKKLVEQDKVLAVVAMRSSVCLPLNPISKQKHVPLLCGAGHPNFVPGNEFAHQSWPLTEVEGQKLAEHVLSQDVKDIAIITGEDEWLLSLSTKFSESFQAKGGKVSISETMLTTDYDANSLLTKIRSKNPAGLFINLTVAQGATAIKRARELGLKMPIYSNFWSGEESALKVAGSAMEGVSYTESNLDFPGFVKVLEALPNAKKASGATMSCFTSTSAILQAINNKEIKSSDDVQNALLELKKVDLLDVLIPVKDRHFMFPMAIKQIKDGKVVKIK